MQRVAVEYLEAIRKARDVFGFHFDNGNYIKAIETDRFTVYQVLPTDKDVKVRKNAKPIIILPPYVLRLNILAFYPMRGRATPTASLTKVYQHTSG